MDNDGKLTCDEFCIAMHLSDMARLGRALPPKLPPELMPSKARAGSFGPGTGGIAGAMPAGALPPPQTGMLGLKHTFVFCIISAERMVPLCSVLARSP